MCSSLTVQLSILMFSSSVSSAALTVVTINHQRTNFHSFFLSLQRIGTCVWANVPLTCSFMGHYSPPQKKYIYILLHWLQSTLGKCPGMPVYQSGPGGRQQWNCSQKPCVSLNCLVCPIQTTKQVNKLTKNHVELFLRNSFKD